MGYAIGALLTGILADAFGIPASIVAVGVLTVAIGIWADYRMRCGTSSPSIWVWMRQKSLFRKSRQTTSQRDYHHQSDRHSSLIPHKTE
jgi:hypothetical protein